MKSHQHGQQPVMHVEARWAELGIGGPRIDFLHETFSRVTDEHCARCGRQGTVWGNSDHRRRLCTACGTVARFEVPLEPATDHWATILGCIRKTAGEAPTAQR